MPEFSISGPHKLAALRPVSAGSKHFDHGQEERGLLAEFDPAASADAPLAVFEENDAYYIPVHGFDRVSRPGPLVRIYAFDAEE